MVNFSVILMYCRANMVCDSAHIHKLLKLHEKHKFVKHYRYKFVKHYRYLFVQQYLEGQIFKIPDQTTS